MLRLDRIYVRGLDVERTVAHRGRPWRRISDHAPLSAVLTLE
jgi:endonuclease/exonuclease/phosphatase family metal-dependent hydrolase